MTHIQPLPGRLLAMRAGPDGEVLEYLSPWRIISVHPTPFPTDNGKTWVQVRGNMYRPDYSKAPPVVCIHDGERELAEYVEPPK